MAWIPALVLLAMSLTYLFSCLQVLAAPGTGFDLTYLGRGGAIRVKSDSYSIDPARQTLDAYGITVMDLGGNEIATAKKLRVARKGSAIDVAVTDIVGTIVRRADGSFNALDLLPPENPDSKPMSFHLSANRAVITLEDRSGGQVLQDVFELTEVEFSTDGKQNVLSSDLEWADTLQARLQARIDSNNNFAVQFDRFEADLAKARPTVARWLPADTLKLVNEWSVSSAPVNGQISLEGTPKEITRVHGELAIQGREVTHKDYVSGASVDARVTVFTKSALLTAKVVEPGRSVTWDGPISWSNGIAGSGKVRVELADSRRAWPLVARSLPSDVRLTGSQFEGEIAVSGDKFSASGLVSAKTAAVAGESFTGISGDVIADHSRISLVIDKTQWRGAEVAGWLTADYSGKFLTGMFETHGDKLVALEFPLENGKLTLAARSKALVSGSPSDPRVLVDVTGFAQLDLEDRKVLLGEVDTRLNWRDNLATIDRAVLSGPNGVVHGSGTVNTKSNNLDVEIEVAGIDLSAWTDQAEGVGYGSGRITGLVSDPVLTLNTTLLNLSAAGVIIPKAVGEITYSGQELLADKIEVLYGLGSVTGSASVNLESGKIAGLLSAKDIFLADLIPDSPLIGRVGADSIVLSGSLEDPYVAVSALGEDVLLNGVPFTDVTLSGSGNLKHFKLDQLSAKVDDGLLSATGEYFPESKRGKATFEVTDIPLARLPVDQELLEFGGTVSGNGVVESAGDQKWFGSSQLSLSGILVNNFDAGNGAFSIEIKNDLVSISGGISSLNGLVEVPEATYSLDSGDVSGDLFLTNIEVAGVLRAVSRQIKLPDIQTERVVRDLEGLLSAEINFTQVEKDWAVDVKSFSGRNLVSLGRKLGFVELAGQGSAKEATIGHLRWTIPAEGESPVASVAELSGSWKKGELDDEIDISGRLVQFDPFSLNILWQDGPEYHANINADFIAYGPTKDLSGQASLTATDLQIKGADGAMVDVPVSAIVDSIEFEDNVLSALGKVRYQGLEGDLAANVPLSAFEENPSANAEASIKLGTRPIASLERYFPALDYSRTRGSISGALSVSGNRLGYELGGEAKFGSDADGPAELALKESRLSLEDVNVLLTSAGEKLSLMAQGSGSLGGQLAVQADVNLRRFLQGELSIESLQSATLEGSSVVFTEFKVAEKIRLANPAAGAGEPAFFEASRPTTGQIDGEIAIGGTVGKPIIGGELRASNLNISLPPAFPESTGSKKSELDPRFNNFRLVAIPGTVLNIPTGNLKLSGTTVLDGDLSEVDIRAPFTVQSGTLNLPASRVSLEEGTVLVTSGFGGEARAEIDLRGWTVVTARRTSDQYQTYRLNLEIQGNLLDPEGVRISGTSDPPDLSVEEIRAIVGQRDFIESLLDTALGTGDRRSGIASSVFTLAIPSLTQQLTSDLAAALDLDYLALDYNAFDGAIVRAGREMSRGLMLEFSRQITQQSGLDLKYELRLSYRPPTKNQFLSRFRISAGITERVPWKVGISWTSKF